MAMLKRHEFVTTYEKCAMLIVSKRTEEDVMAAPLRILTVDVGTGTQDIFFFESGKTIENCFKLVMPSPTVIVAERIKHATEHGQAIILTGVTMGGGPSHWAACDHALAGYSVAVTPDAARTFDDD